MSPQQDGQGISEMLVWLTSTHSQETTLPSSPGQHLGLARDLCIWCCPNVRATLETPNSYTHCQGTGRPALDISAPEVLPTLCYWKTEAAKKRVKNQKHQPFWQRGKLTELMVKQYSSEAEERCVAWEAQRHLQHMQGGSAKVLMAIAPLR